MAGYGYSPFSTGNSRDIKITNLQNLISSRDEVINSLLQKVEALEVKSSANIHRKNSQKVEEKTTTKKSKITPSKKSTIKTKEKNPSPTNHPRKRPSASTPPIKRSPVQMVMCEVPEDFIHAKYVLFKL
ncbi:hypothetical protein O181_000771 [Austropuccinia psidii MF-1]|uniref:Uncharacterized protein n=1 Tax=Austropuccinia psidii MF-1 TaxID=1389203 RepID=A0A9Q3B947_9BASI|nr:hypothetical protein [Austropuccinia psidii MF-1]